MPPAPECTMRARTSSVPSLSSAADDGFDRTLHVALDDQREFLEAGVLQLRHHLLERTALAGMPGHGLVAGQPLTVLGDFAGARFVLDDGEAVAACGVPDRPRTSTGMDRRRFLDLLALVVDERANAAPLGRRRR